MCHELRCLAEILSPSANYKMSPFLYEFRLKFILGPQINGVQPVFIILDLVVFIADNSGLLVSFDEISYSLLKSQWSSFLDLHLEHNSCILRFYSGPQTRLGSDNSNDVAVLPIGSCSRLSIKHTAYTFFLHTDHPQWFWCIFHKLNMQLMISKHFM